jgi:Cu2+-exporting ATPase
MKMEHEHSHHEHKMHRQNEEMKHSKHEHQKHNRSHGHEGHDHHAMMIEDFKKRFYVVLILTVPIMLLSQMIQHWLNLHLSFTGSDRLCYHCCLCL